MKKIDDLGRVVIPKEIREAAKIEIGDPIVFSAENGRICIEKHSTAEMVEVVRCKDCEYSETDEHGNTWCAFYSEKIREMPNGYCWHGKRKEDG